MNKVHLVMFFIAFTFGMDVANAGFDVALAKETFEKTGIAIICTKGQVDDANQVNTYISQIVKKTDFAIISPPASNDLSGVLCITVRNGGDGRR